MPMFAIDGGNTTGLCYGIFPLTGTMKGKVARAKFLTHEHVGVADGPKGLGFGTLGSGDLGELAVIDEVVSRWSDWNDKLAGLGEGGLGPSIVLIEDFILRTDVGRARYVLSSVKVAYGFMAASVLSERGGVKEGMEWLHLPVMYQPSEAVGFATKERMKRWGLWKPGLNHANSAARLIALHLAKLKEKGVR
jgi:hypothetical protein